MPSPVTKSAPLTISYPIRFRRKRVGVINVADKISGDPFDEQDMEFLSTLASQVAVAIENARLVDEMEGGYLSALVALIHAGEEARPETRGHSRRVAELAAGIATAMDLPETRRRSLARAAALHEVGRLVLHPAGSDNGNGGLDLGEGWTAAAVMATERILTPIASLREAREIILHSINPCDDPAVSFNAEGLGIPLESRILAVCEEYVRRTTADGQDPERRRAALQAVRERAGRGHDAAVVAALSRLVEGGEER